jgi:transaldolase
MGRHTSSRDVFKYYLYNIRLEKEGIHCNLTLILSFIQAVACAQAGIFLISPFVGRVNDGFSQKYSKSYQPHEEPGISLVKEIYHYFKKYDHNTIIMAASLRTPESVLELTGCDRITIPPGIIQKLAKMDVTVEQRLDVESSKKIENLNELGHLDEKTFRWSLNQDEIGNEKLADGIRIFGRDAVKLESVIRMKLSSA